MEEINTEKQHEKAEFERDELRENGAHRDECPHCLGGKCECQCRMCQPHLWNLEDL